MEIKDLRVETDPDYIKLSKFSYSLKKFLAKHPNGAEPAVIAEALGIEVDKVKYHYNIIVQKLRRMIK